MVPSVLPPRAWYVHADTHFLHPFQQCGYNGPTSVLSVVVRRFHCFYLFCCPQGPKGMKGVRGLMVRANVRDYYSRRVICLITSYTRSLTNKHSRVSIRAVSRDNRPPGNGFIREYMFSLKNFDRKRAHFCRFRFLRTVCGPNLRLRKLPARNAISSKRPNRVTVFDRSETYRTDFVW